ncbi:PadR family transcriptional regulator [Streptomyces albus]|uniref:PadR family transcriptional regulator n=1 Tax=Streptomyces albus TaxID=1888 RepID=UPI00099C4131|nr:PadR family transcriptional regulator [Streptomyces albus]
MPETRLTSTSYLVLGIIGQLGEASPYDVKVEASRTVAPFWQVPHAQVYAQCDRLLAAGLLSQTRQDGGRNRRVMRLTETGREALGRWLADDAFVPVEARERNILKLWFGARHDLVAPTQVREHRRTLEEYLTLAADVGALLTLGQRQALEYGIRYERMMTEFWEWVESGARPADGGNDDGGGPHPGSGPGPDPGPSSDPGLGSDPGIRKE